MPPSLLFIAQGYVQTHGARKSGAIRAPGERAQIAFIEHVATARGADIALRRLLKAEAIRESVVRSLQATEEQDEEAPQASVERLAVLH
ncbi:hypothetical protein [Ralstonia syzygii]|uniref:hypothetical protein n=1 Tax=Ralstonia syzygii TaxID=28097 RepID=UPI001E40C04F|nr:hypothetical protein [Ralstonia syzygii]